MLPNKSALLLFFFFNTMFMMIFLKEAVLGELVYTQIQPMKCGMRSAGGPSTWFLSGGSSSNARGVFLPAQRGTGLIWD